MKKILNLLIGIFIIFLYNSLGINLKIQKIEFEEKDILEIGSQEKNTKNEKILYREASFSQQCSDNCTNCGPGRENGFTEVYDSKGCRNWEGWSYGCYGFSDIPFWINLQSFNTIANASHKGLLLQDIKYQISLWNQAVMHDTSNSIINLYEVGIGSSSLPHDINGKKVVEIKREDGNYAGQFNPDSLQIKINYSNTSSGTRPGRNIDTPMHELGHLLGLNDLDEEVNFGTHKTLMGYYRKTNELNIMDAITYHDIQGVAVLNGKHKTHQFKRYYNKNNKYIHICFYCDSIEESDLVKAGSMLFENSNSCEHKYKQLVSLGEKHWLKCTKCYKVITHTHEFAYKKINEVEHLCSCSCGYSKTLTHVNNNHKCIYCGTYLSEHDYEAPYSWINNLYHKATCSCGNSTTQLHSVSNGAFNNGVKYATCLLCGGMAETGFVGIDTINLNSVIDENNNHTYLNSRNQFYQNNENNVIKFFNFNFPGLEIWCKE